MGYTEVDRNSWIERSVIGVDQEFFALRMNLQQWRTASNVGSSITALLANVASTLTQSPGVKSNYTALNSLVIGIDGIVDREQFLEQTVTALVAAMEGRRAEVYARIRVGMAKGTREYTISDAHRDVHAYAAAGRPEEGIKFVVAATEAARDSAQADADRKIEDIVGYTDEERQLVFCVTRSIESLDSGRESELRALLTDMRVSVPASAGFNDLIDLFKKARMNGSPEFQRDVAARVTRAGMLLNPCPEY